MLYNSAQNYNKFKVNIYWHCMEAKNKNSSYIFDKKKHDEP
jgi:hypothetical protein